MYQRFLNNNDYLAVVSEESLEQLIRGKEERLAQAEEAAEESIIEYLSEGYMIEEALAVGKNLRPYNRQISYPAGAHFVMGNKIFRATRTINGIKRPAKDTYWVEYSEYIEPEAVPPYTQRGSYVPGEIVNFNGINYRCTEYNGVDYGDVRVPGIEAWAALDNVTEWQPNYEYQMMDVVLYDDNFYTIVKLDDVDWTKNPYDGDHWGLIGDYDENYNKYTLSDDEFVVYNGKVYYPILNPNSDEPTENYNIIVSDPRNANIKKHLLRLAVFELYKLISPTNISSTRLKDYEISIIWLRDASRMRINPQLPRRINNENKPVSRIAIATFRRDYDPYENPWQI